MKSIIVTSLAGMALCVGGVAVAQHPSTQHGQHQGVPVSLNQANLKQLIGLPGIGKKTAQRILDYRKQHGAFKSIKGLVKVRGVSKHRIQSWGQQVRL